MPTLKNKIRAQNKANEKTKVKLDNESDIIEAPKRKWLTKEEKAEKRIHMKELRKKGKEEQERKQIIHNFVASIFENVISKSELAQSNDIYIRPKIRTRNIIVQNTACTMYTAEQLEKMKGTRVGDIINSIYRIKI